MKKVFILIICLLFSKQTILAQDDWMNSLYAAKRLALTQDKMLLMVWEESMFYRLPALITVGNDKYFLIKNLFESPQINALLWDHFVLVKVSEDEFTDWYKTIRKKRSPRYLEKFGADDLKVLDVNGNILNTSLDEDFPLNLNKFIYKYALNTSYLKQELINYNKERTFYSTFYLASKYIDYAFYVDNQVREEIINLSAIYLEEAKELLLVEDLDNKIGLDQRIELLEIEQYLVLGQPKKSLRKLKKIEKSTIHGANNQLYAFLCFVAYRMLWDEQNAALWRPKISMADLDKAKNIINHY